MLILRIGNITKVKQQTKDKFQSKWLITYLSLKLLIYLKNKQNKKKQCCKDSAKQPKTEHRERAVNISLTCCELNKLLKLQIEKRRPQTSETLGQSISSSPTSNIKVELPTSQKKKKKKKCCICTQSKHLHRQHANKSHSLSCFEGKGGLLENTLVLNKLWLWESRKCICAVLKNSTNVSKH